MVARLVLLAALVLALAGPSLAQDSLRIEFSVDPPVVRPGESATIHLIVQGSGAIRVGDPAPVDDLVIRPGSSQDVVSSMMGTVSATRLMSWSVVPMRPGIFEIQPLDVEVGGRLYRTEALTLSVEGGGDEVWDVPPATWGDPLVVEARVDRKEAYVGEPILWTFRLYQSVNLRVSPEFVPPSTPGFVAVEGPRREFVTALGGTSYGVAEAPLLLFPHAAGTLTIGGAAVRVKQAAFNPMDLYDHPNFVRRLFTGPTQGLLATEDIPVKILPLPKEGRPSDFTGAVGKFRLQASLDRTEVPSGQPVNLEVRVQGEGNLNLLDPPTLPSLPDFKVYETTSSGGIDKGSVTASGTRTFTTVLVPRSPGERTVKGLRFSYFDPEARAYRTLEAPPLALRVTPGHDVAPEPSASPEEPEAQDGIRAPRQVPGAGRPLPVLDLPWLVALQGAPLLALLAWLLLRGRSPRRRSTDAGKAARQRLSQMAREGLEAPALAGLLRDYLGGRLGPGLRAASRREIEEALEARGVSAEARGSLQALLDDLDLAVYAPGGSSTAALEGLRTRALEVLDGLEATLR